MSVWSLLIRDARFWAALLLLVRALLYAFWPAFPAAAWAAVDAFAAAVLAILSGHHVVQAQRGARGRG